MANSKDERILNLVFVLLNTKLPLTRAQIRDRIDGYPTDSDMAFERMFERDKKVLRELEIPLRTQKLSEAHDDVEGYIIEDSEWMMDDLVLSPAERVLVSLAAHAWGDVQMGKYARDAAAAIGAIDEPQLDFRFGISGNQTHAPAILDAIARKKGISFMYQGRGVDEASLRQVDPWRLLVTDGSWYLIGYDHGKSAQRTYKLARIHGGIAVTANDITHDKPTGFNAHDVISDWRETDEMRVAQVRVANDDGASIRLIASEIEQTDDGDVITVNYWSEDSLARKIAAMCDRVEVLSPVELRMAVGAIVHKAGERHAS